jgi:hypothetical protein
MEKYRERIIYKFVAKIQPPRLKGYMHYGRFISVYSSDAKTKFGVKYNRLIRLSTKLRTRAKL